MAVGVGGKTMTNPYLELTRNLNQGRLRALISSGQAVVVHRLAIMSKDGDWILREDAEVVSLEPLAAMKMTRREKDYAVIGELARRMEDPRSQILYSRSSRDLMRLAAKYPDVLAEMTPRRPLLRLVSNGRDALEEALDRERRAAMHADEERLARYQAAARVWSALWPAVARQIDGLPLREAHRAVTSNAEAALPFSLPEEAAP